MTIYSLEVDASELRCPLPLLKLKQALNNVAIGETVLLIATDPASKRDVVSFAELTGQQVTVSEKDCVYRYSVTKGERH
jgi:tRNA 2-thiouridine synthesizing protein A